MVTVEMERAMCMPPGLTAMPGLPDKQRHHVIGNSFHVSVVAHIFRWWNLHQQAWGPTCGYDGESPHRWWDLSHDDWDATMGYEDEGPSRQQLKLRKQAYKPLNELSYRRKTIVTISSTAKATTRERSTASKYRKRAGRQVRDTGGAAMWKSSIPTMPQKCCSPSLMRVWEYVSWEDTSRNLLPVVAPVFPLG